MPDRMHAQLVEFLTKHREQPFYVYYSMSHVHSDILPTPDSATDSRTLYEDNLAYMDKLVGLLLAELDRLKLRENTLLVFFGDNGTAKARSDRATIGGRRLSGEKGSMLEGGGLVPLIVQWPGRVPADRVCADLFDASDFVPTFAEVAGAPLPNATKLDGQSQLASWRGIEGKRREWAFNQLADHYYVRSADWKLNEKGELFDMRGAPFTEPLVPSDSVDAAAPTARKQLQAALDQLRPQDGIRDRGDGTGRHANRKSDAKKDK
jgi:arylsulfatase A